MTLEGFDISNWQTGAYTGGGGFSFGVAKASEGIGFKDPSYDRHITAIRASGIVPGAYHFCRPDLNPGNPEGEADWFLEVIGDATGMLLQCDAESNGGSADWCIRFQRRLRDRLGGYHATFYSYLNWIQTRDLASIPELGDYALWFAWPPANGPMPTPAPWPFVSIQQWGLTSVPGITSGGADADTFFGDLDQLKALTVGGRLPQMTDDQLRAMVAQWYTVHVGHWPPDGERDYFVADIKARGADVAYLAFLQNIEANPGLVHAPPDHPELPVHLKDVQDAVAAVPAGPAGPKGDPGPAYDDSAIKARLDTVEADLSGIKAAIK